jgi:uncharacterized protein
VGVADLLRRPGSQREVRIAAVLDDLELSSTTAREGEPVDVEVVLESLSEAIVVTGRLTVEWTGDCRRCLRPVAGRAVADVREVFEVHPVEGDTYLLEGDQLDLEPMVRDAVLLGLPLAPVCGDDCLGPDPEGYPVVVDAERGLDPRWAKLGDLRLGNESS